MSTTTQRPTPEVNAHRDEMNHYEFDEELALTYELAKRLECERDEARDQLEAMREAIKEAEALLIAVDNGAQQDVNGVNWYDRRKLAIAKLQPFLKP